MRIFFATLVFVGIAVPIDAGNLKCGQTPIRPNVLVDSTLGPKKEGIFVRRILGGSLTTPNSWPWQVLLSWSNGTHEELCGGTIIAEHWISTAAHCFSGFHPEDVKAYVGVQKQNARGKPLDVLKMYEHPQYIALFNVHDIKLIELKEPLKYNNTVQPVCLPSADDAAIAPPNTAWATGWGFTNVNGPDSNELMEVKVPFIDMATCNKDYGWIMDGLQVCAFEKGKGVCFGDSGGPLVAQSSDGSWFQHGIASWAPGCGVTTPEVYTRVSGYCDWIKSTTRGAAVCHKP